MPTTSTCTFTNHRDEQLSARLEHPDGTAHATAVFAHCFTCSKDLRAARRLARTLAGRGIAVLSFDFTGLGSSEGDFAASTFSSDVDDLVAAAEYLAEEMTAPTLLVGHSLGGAAVLTAAARMPEVEAVATIGAPADVDHVTQMFVDDLGTIEQQGEARVSLAGREFPIRASFVEDLRSHRLVDTVATLDTALLFLHAPLDNVVGISNAQKLFGAARRARSFVSLDDADHLLSDPADARYAAEVIAAWATRYLSGVTSREDDASTGDDDIRMPVGSGNYDHGHVVATNTGGLQADVATRGFRLRVDEPASAGGTETGPTPYDYLGTALAACTSMTVRMYADRKDLPLEGVTTTVGFDRVHARDCEDCEHTEGRIERFTRTVALRGDLDDEARDKLLSIANRCPVHRTLEGQIEIRTESA